MAVARDDQRDAGLQRGRCDQWPGQVLASRVRKFASARTRHLGFGVLCLLLAVIAAITGTWIPLAILLVVGAVFVGRGMTMPRS